MKKKVVALLMVVLVGTLCVTGCGSSKETAADNSIEAEVENMQAETDETVDTADIEAETDQEAADEVAALIDAIYVQERTAETDRLCADAKAAWDALTDAQKELVEGVNGALPRCNF